MPLEVSRRSALKALAGVGLAVHGAAAANRPDVLFISVDDMNNWLTLYDPKNPIKTPSLERLARRGVFFDHAYAAAPMCNPSRTAILTGLRPTSTGVYGNPDSPREVLKNKLTIPRHFMKSGYWTQAGGKVFHYGVADDPENPSFHLVLNRPVELFGRPLDRAPAQNYTGFTQGRMAAPVFDFGEHDKKIIDVDLVEWVSGELKRPRNRPLFQAVGILRPHLPFYAPPEYFRMYPFEKVVQPPMPANDLDDVPPTGKKLADWERFVYDAVTSQPESSPGSLRRYVQSYQAAASFADAMVGRVLDALDASGKASNTIIVLWSDNGYHLGDKNSCVKFTLWEKSCNVPLIIVAPGIAAAGTRCSQPVSFVDVFPTLVELAGLPAAEGLDGRSLVPLLRNPAMQWEQPALMTSGRGNHAVRSQRWRYIRYADGTEELYDHEKDPWEWKNLAGGTQYTDVINRHKAWLPKQEAPARL